MRNDRQPWPATGGDCPAVARTNLAYANSSPIPAYAYLTTPRMPWFLSGKNTATNSLAPRVAVQFDYGRHLQQFPGHQLVDNDIGNLQRYNEMLMACRCKMKYFPHQFEGV